MIASLVCFFAAIVCYAIVQTLQLRPLDSIWADAEPFSFWGRNSWARKYAGRKKKYSRLMLPAPDNWYYRKFKIKYQERFPGSATVFVWVTDALHFFQFMYFNLICLALVFPANAPLLDSVITFLLLRLGYWIFFGWWFEWVFLKRK